MTAPASASITLIFSVVIGIFVNLYSELLKSMSFGQTLMHYESWILVIFVVANVVFIFRIKAEIEASELSLEAFRNDPDLQGVVKGKIKEQLSQSTSVTEMVQVAKESGQLLKRGKRK